MTIYIDVVLIENLFMNYIILFATGYILKMKRRYLNLFISAMIGGVYSILAYMRVLELYSNFFMKIILSITMIYIAYSPKNIKEMLKVLLFFYLISFVFGGCAFAFLYFIKPQEILYRNGVFVGTYPIKITILGAMIGFIVVHIAFYIIKTKINKKNIFCDLTIFIQKDEIELKALIDTGNMLKDPITNRPVIVVEKKSLQGIIPNEILNNLESILGGDTRKKIYSEENINYISKFRVIPFKSLGKENGLLLGFKVDKITIKREENESQINDVIVGIYNYELSKNGRYSALVGLDIIEGSENGEFVENVNGKY